MSESTDQPKQQRKANGAKDGAEARPSPVGTGDATSIGRRETIRGILNKYPPASSTKSTTVQVQQELREEIAELVHEEQRLLERLEAISPDNFEPLQLGQLAADVTRTSDELTAKLKRLQSLERGGSRLPPAEFDGRELIPELANRVAVRVTDALVSRTRVRREVTDTSLPRRVPGEPLTIHDPTNMHAVTPIEHHDVLVIAPRGVHSKEQFYRFPVIKSVSLDTQAPDLQAVGKAAARVHDGEERVGQYRDAPELFDAFDYGQRRALSMARPQDWGSASVRATERGPAFSTLPLKPEPEQAGGGPSDSSVCYLINTQNLNFRNAWTAEEWNDTPGGVNLPAAQGAAQNELEALLAGPQGKVFRLQLTHVSAWKKGTTARVVASMEDADGVIEQRDLGVIESVDLRPHMEVWHQLRGGTAMGRVYFDDASGPRVIPLVNITSLTLD